jgi:hypothetical protein
MNLRSLRYKLHQHLGPRTQTFVDPSDDLLLDKLGGPVGRLKDIGNVVLVHAAVSTIVDRIDPTVDHSTRDAPSEACQLDQFATALEPQQYENTSDTQKDREKGCGDAGTNEPA